MKKVTYLAVFEPTAQGYAVSFPDLPGCVSCGASFEAARRGAEDALGLHLYGLERDGETVPPPSAAVTADPETAPGFFLSPVTVYPDLVRGELDARRIKTNTTIPAWLKDAAEEHGGVNYSRLLETALLEYLHLPARPGS